MKEKEFTTKTRSFSPPILLVPNVKEETNYIDSAVQLKGSPDRNNAAVMLNGLFIRDYRFPRELWHKNSCKDDGSHNKHD